MLKTNNEVADSKSPIFARAKSYFEDIFTVAEKYIKNLTEYSNLLIDFLKTMQFEKEGSKTKLMLLLMKYGSKRELLTQMKLLKEEIEAANKKTNRLIEETQQILQKETLMCPECDGKGRISKVKYIREDGMVMPDIDFTACPTCNGEGSVRISEELHEYLTIILRAAKDVMELGRIFNQTFQEITAIYEISKDVSDNQIKTLQESFTGKDNEIATLRAEIRDLKESLTEKNNEIDTLRAGMKSLKSIRQDREGKTVITYCKNCRTKLPEGVDYCPNCGVAIKPLVRFAYLIKRVG